MNVNLTIKNVTKIALLLKNFSGHSSCNKIQDVVKVSSSDCQLFRFRLGRLSKVKGVNDWFTGFSIHCQFQPTSRTQASIAHSSAESELYAMTQAAVESLAIKNFIQEFSSAILSAEISIVIQTDSSAGKSMASRLGMSRRSKHVELKYLWIQDGQRRHIGAQKGGSSFQPIRCSHKVCFSFSIGSASSSS